MRQATRQECHCWTRAIFSLDHSFGQGPRLAGGLYSKRHRRLTYLLTLGTGNTPEFEEERRLLYVAMARAKDHLHLILPQRFFAHQQKSNGDRHMYTARTRFIPDSIVDRFEVCAWPEATTAAMAKSANVRPVDIGTRMRRM